MSDLLIQLDTCRNMLRIGTGCAMMIKRKQEETRPSQKKLGYF